MRPTTVTAATFYRMRKKLKRARSRLREEKAAGSIRRRASFFIPSCHPLRLANMFHLIWWFDLVWSSTEVCWLTCLLDRSEVQGSNLSSGIFLCGISMFSLLLCGIVSSNSSFLPHYTSGHIRFIKDSKLPIGANIQKMWMTVYMWPVIGCRPIQCFHPKSGMGIGIGFRSCTPPPQMRTSRFDGFN